MSTNLRGVRSLEQHVALMETARSLMTTAIPPRDGLAPGVQSGELDNYRWQIDVAPLGADWIVPDGDAIWVPGLVTIHVRSSSGGGVDLETIRLMHRPRQ
jgi:general secretion pathway protein I